MMKKILISFVLSLASISYAQNLTAKSWIVADEHGKILAN